MGVLEDGTEMDGIGPEEVAMHVVRHFQVDTSPTNRSFPAREV